MSPAPRRALLSVSDRQGVAEFASRLARAGWELVSTGGTAAHLRGAGLPVTDVSAITGLPEMLDGRVKTLHPSVHGAILARLDLESHRAAIDAAGIHPIALVVVNLYPFRETVAREDVTLEAAVENIDIGGPALIRAAAKNHPHVTVLTDPADYDRVAAQIEAGGETADDSGHLRGGRRVGVGVHDEQARRRHAGRLGDRGRGDTQGLLGAALH